MKLVFSIMICSFTWTASDVLVWLAVVMHIKTTRPFPLEVMQTKNRAKEDLTVDTVYYNDPKASLTKSYCGFMWHGYVNVQQLASTCNVRKEK